MHDGHDHHHPPLAADPPETEQVARSRVMEAAVRSLLIEKGLVTASAQVQDAVVASLYGLFVGTNGVCGAGLVFLNAVPWSWGPGRHYAGCLHAMGLLA